MSYTMSEIAVKHNIEVAHRLFELPGKCENIHGHSMWVTLKIEGQLNDKGILSGIEYGALKKVFRGHLDTEYDHRLLLNASDPFAGELMAVRRGSEGQIHEDSTGGLRLPGLQACPGDPTTENIARWVLEHMKYVLTVDMDMGVDDIRALDVTVWETSVNMARYTEDYTPEEIL